MQLLFLSLYHTTLRSISVKTQPKSCKCDHRQREVYEDSENKWDWEYDCVCRDSSSDDT